MAMESFFMDELQNIKNEPSASAKVRNISTNIDHGTVDSLQTKIKLLKTDKKRYACNNRDDLLHLSFTLKISIFLEAYA